jgi:hypothetical protein
MYSFNITVEKSGGAKHFVTKAWHKIGDVMYARLYTNKSVKHVAVEVTHEDSQWVDPCNGPWLRDELDNTGRFEYGESDDDIYYDDQEEFYWNGKD